jgi:hypothetical protein
MKKQKKAAMRVFKNLSAGEDTEQIVQMIASSIASLPRKERLAAMQAFDMTAEGLSTRGNKAARKRKTRRS